MKKYAFATVLALLLALLSLNVFASETLDRDDCANALYSLGLLKGYDDSGKVFKPDNSLTRAESIVQVVRFLGKEQEALDGGYTVPFTDVADWAVPYIGYAYANGITSGRSATEFDPDTAVDEAQFLTLLLRAMDYSDKNGDFVWSDPFALANKVGLTARTAAGDAYTRGDAFIACYNALVSKCKGGKTVADKLIAASVITEVSFGYAKRIAGGERITVACVGDSITQGTGASNASLYSYPAQLQKLLGQGYLVVNCGKASSYVMNPDLPYTRSGLKTELWYPNTAEYKRLMSIEPDVVIVMLGTNDARSLTAAAAIDTFVTSYKALIADIQSLSSKPDIYLSSMIPAVNADETYSGTVYVLPEVIEGIAKDLDLPFIPTHEILHDYYKVMLPNGDSVHPKDDSYSALAVNFYNEVFGGRAELPTLPTAKGNVVFVADTGKDTNGGTSPTDAVKSLSLAIAMLREEGGTVVLSGRTTTKGGYLVSCGGPVTITSTYDGVDYYKTNKAFLALGGSLTLASDLVIDNLMVQVTASGKMINCNYNNFTVGSGASFIGSELSLNVGYRCTLGAVTAETVSCHTDCTVDIAGGKWLVLRGGNMRTSGTSPIGTIDKGVTLTINISGGEFTFVATASNPAANTAVGMNSCDGDVLLDISGGTFKGTVYGLSRIGTTPAGTKATFNGNITMNITGGTFENGIGLYQNSDAPVVGGKAILNIKESLRPLANVDGFEKVTLLP